VNWYVYANSNPILYVDPYGLISVIFVASSMAGQAEARKNTYTMFYGTDTSVMKVKSPEDFISKWNAFFENVKNNCGEIDAIEIISHGGISGDIGKDDNGTAYSTGYLFFADSNNKKLYARTVNGMSTSDRSISDLNSVKAKELNINSCNSANPDTYNIIYGFMQNMDIIEKMTGFDGGTDWDRGSADHVRGGGEYVDR
jgi:hypothetical protein